jgi:hypothetical protein
LVEGDRDYRQLVRSSHR